MMMRRKGQFSSIEIVLLVMLFAFTSAYFYIPMESTMQDYKLSIDSGIDAIYYSDDYRSLVMNEELAVFFISEDWSDLNTTLNKMYRNFEVIVGNGSVNKTVISCRDGNYTTKYYTERVVAIEDNDNFEFRNLRLGVCY